MKTLPQIGSQLRQARKIRFPGDDLAAFAMRIGVSRATLQKMEKGELSVTLANYHRAAEVLSLSHTFSSLFELPESLFDD